MDDPTTIAGVDGEGLVEQLFRLACELPPGKRGAFLDTRCGTDAKLRRTVEELLRHEAAAAPGFLGGAVVDEPAALGPGDVIGPYRIIRVVGEGGFGTVYQAEQSAPIQRMVALKVVKLGMDTREVIARFETERQALAMMNHPSIARVLDAGATETGRPYFVMEFVKGVPITEYCNKNRLGTNERLDLFVQVCDAVQHAHHKGVIHRDLKPSNVLVTVESGDAVSKVIDFGVAKAVTRRLAEQTLYTERGQLVGTPEYISPEQAEMSGLDIDARSDIYSLGVLLYELLTGGLPFPRERLYESTFDEMRRMIREDEPARPSTRLGTLGDDAGEVATLRRSNPTTLLREVQGDLDWIVMRALEKDRTRRYATASELAADIERHRQQMPVLAGPPSVTYRARKFVRRHRVGVLAGVTAGLALIAGIVGTATMAVVAARERDATQVALEEVDRARARAAAINTFLTEMLEAPNPWRATAGRGIAREMRVVEVLDDAAKRVEVALGAEPLLEAEVRATIGRTYRNLGHYGKAERHLVRAATIRRERLGADHVDTLRSMNDLGVLRMEQGDYDRADNLLEQVLDVRRARHGAEDGRTVASQQNLASLRRRQGRYEEAEVLLDEVLRTQRDTLGRADPATLRTVNGLAAVHIELGRFREAETLLKDAIRTTREVLGQEDTRVILLMRSLASLYQRSGRLTDAEALLRELLALCRRLLDDHHGDTLAVMNDLALVYQKLGRLDREEVLLVAVLRLYRMHAGGGHPITAVAMKNLAGLRRRQGRYDEAEQLFNEALAVQLGVLPERHPAVLDTQNGIGVLHMARGRLEEAEPILTHVLDVRRELLGEQSLETLASMSNLAELYRRSERLDEAASLQRAAFDTSVRVLGQEHWTTIVLAANLGAILVEQEACDRALRWLEMAVNGRRRILPPDHVDIGETLVHLGHCLSAVGRYDDAESTLLEAHRILAEAGDDARPVRAIDALIDLYRRWGRTDEETLWKTRRPPM